METQWQLRETKPIDPELLNTIQDLLPQLNLEYGQGQYLAQLLQQRGITQPEKIKGFLDCNSYQPVSPLAFGQEMKSALNRLLRARTQGEKVAIWGDFDADGITATSVLWEGLGEFFSPHETLFYYIPNRFTESHGLNRMGIEKLHQHNVSLIVTCDTGSTNFLEIDFAHSLGIDLIITDHHTLPDDRPEVISILNPRYFASTHPLYNLSGVAVAYKLIEALYSTVPHIPQQPLENLLDLVVIGLIADLVALEGDCRYLAQKGLKQLQKQNNPATATRPGVAQLLSFCNRNGDRPTDISFGIGPRINAISRIHGDGHFGVELLTSKNPQRCAQLALETELANSRRKEVQQHTLKQVKQQLEQIDLSTTSVIVLANSQWQGGVLGLVAGQIAQEYGRPTILLSYNEDNELKEPILAKGSARSIQNINLYDLVHSQAHLLHRFGGHPLAAGLSLPLENLELFKEGINQALRQNFSLNENSLKPIITADLTVTVSELGQDLFKELKLIEPCGMGNPVPKLIVKNCWFTNVSNKNITDHKGGEIKYIKTFFKLWDDTVNQGFEGVWWGHYSEEIIPNRKYDVILELDYNTYKEKYEVRIIDLKELGVNSQDYSLLTLQNPILDYRNQVTAPRDNLTGIVMNKCPANWTEMRQYYQRAKQLAQPLTLAYGEPPREAPERIWQKLIGLAKYLSRTGEQIALETIKNKLNLSDRSLNIGLKTLENLGFHSQVQLNYLKINQHTQDITSDTLKLNQFITVVKEEQFKQKYFSQIPLTTVQNILYYEDKA